MLKNTITLPSNNEATPNTDNDESQMYASIDASPLIPKGIYTVELLDWVTIAGSKNDPKGNYVDITFKVISGEYTDTVLHAWYPQKPFKATPKRRGQLSMSQKQKLTKEFLRLFPESKRLDRFSLYNLLRKRILAKVEDVTTDWDGVEQSQLLHYSKVAEMISIVNEPQDSEEQRNTRF